MRTLFVLNSLTAGGAERVIVTLLNRLDTSVFSNSLLYLRKKDSILGELDKSRLRSINCYGGTNFLEPGLPFYMARLIEREQIDTVVCVNQRPMLYAFFASFLTRRKFRIIEAIHVTKPVGPYQHYKNFMIYKPLLRHCDRVIFVGGGQLKAWVSSNIADPRNSICIYNGIDVEHFTDKYSLEEKSEVRCNLGFSENAFVVGIFARLHAKKNHCELIAAIKAIRAGGMDAGLLIVGEGPERANLKRLLESGGLSHSAVLAGFRKDVRPLMAACDCIALTSEVESFPLCIIEGMAMGKPVVSSRTEGAIEQIRHGETGFLYESGNINELADYLKILSVTTVRAEIGEKARKTACSRFDLRRMLQEYSNVLVGA